MEFRLYLLNYFITYYCVDMADIYEYKRPAVCLFLLSYLHQLEALQFFKLSSKTKQEANQKMFLIKVTHCH